jgi:hypothetical protein
VPPTPFAGPLRVTVDFDTGPLAGPLHAESTVEIAVP